MAFAVWRRRRVTQNNLSYTQSNTGMQGTQSGGPPGYYQGQSPPQYQGQPPYDQPQYPAPTHNAYDPHAGFAPVSLHLHPFCSAVDTMERVISHSHTQPSSLSTVCLRARYRKPKYNYHCTVRSSRMRLTLRGVSTPISLMDPVGTVLYHFFVIIGHRLPMLSLLLVPWCAISMSQY